MSIRRLSVLQWLALVGGALAWAAQHVVGFGIGQARCSAANVHFGISYKTWEIALLTCAATLLVLGELAAAIVFARTRDVDVEDPPPPGRLHFFAAAALVANLLFLLAVVLDGSASIVGSLCRGG